ncbi:nSTAND1 domain-containing NTPase [Mangrovihabitans endophyticus]|uniref:Novel STAND NTPase 1 domain-containing protein n=1 Tax=Mangrovihabitans endophyticus TaxID=1751298 RepID=A0A8J3FL37_9ACTN|nr:PD40 domain-containing protein [Mangrovihabitans endophyticus]GGK71106.1 hypothetical protein GCM10012284_01100 [Mangrovihabitans endophyticus]
MDVTTEPAERARSGVRAWVRSARSGLRRATPYGIVAFLTASAVAPVAGAGLGLTGEYAAALDQIGELGSNYLAGLLAQTAERVRGTDEQTWRDAVAEELLARLESGDAALRDEVSAVLHAVGAVDAALQAADESLRLELATAFGSFRHDMGRLHLLAEDAAVSLTEIQRHLAEQSREQRQQTDLLRQSLVLTVQLRQAVQDGRRTSESESGPAAAPPSGGADDDVSPYPGLAGFDALDVRFFRGRETLVAELMGRLSEQQVGGPPLVVVGVSGVGKSSLLRAGVLPAIADGGLGSDVAGWPWLVMTPGPRPLAEFTTRMAALGTDRIVILVDQFEELFTQCADPRERVAFVSALAAVRPALVIVALRAGFYAHCTEIAPMVPMLGAGQFVVGPLDSDDLRRAVLEPAAEAGLTVQPGLVELLLTDLGAPGYEPGALPLLAHALRATWERRDARTLTVAGYRRTGGIQRAVAETAERVYVDLDERTRAGLRRALLGLVTVVDGLAVRRRGSPAEVHLEALRPLIDARLVTAGEDLVEITHEALLIGWPRLAGWMEEAREEILLRQRLSQAAAEWAASGDDPDVLYRGSRLDAAREWAADNPDITAEQRRFLAASQEAAQARKRTRLRTTRRLRRLVGGLAVALLLVVAGALIAVQQGSEARHQRQEALSRQLAAESRTDHFPDQLGSVRKALLAWQAAPTREARDALMFAQQTSLVGRLGARAAEASVAVSPDGRRVAVGYRDTNELRLFDAMTLRPVGPARRSPGENLISVAFSPDGRYLATGAVTVVDGLALWDGITGRPLRNLPAFGAVAWLPDSSAVLAVRTEEPLRLVAWDPATGRPIGARQLDRPSVTSLAVSPDGRYVAAATGGDGALLRWSDGHLLTTLGKATDVGFAADGTLFTVRLDGLVQVRRAADDWAPVTAYDGPDPLLDDAGSRFGVTPDGTVIISGDDPGEVLRLTAGGPRPTLAGFRGLLTDAATSADGGLLAVAGLGEAPTLFRRDRIMPHPQVVGRLAYGPAGARLATGSSDPVVRIWDAHTGGLLDTLPLAADDGPLGLAYGPDGSLAVSVRQGSRVLVFGPDGGLRRTLRMASDLFPSAVAFSPDGSLLVAVANPTAQLDPGQDRAPVQERDDPDAYVWDTRTWAARPPVRLPGHLSIDTAFTPDGRYLLISSNRSRDPLPQQGAVWRFRAPGLTLVDSRAFGGAVHHFAVSPDSATVALPRGQGADLVRVDGLTPAGVLGHHPFDVSEVAFSADGHLLATGTDSDTDLIRVWDTGTGDLVTELRGESSRTGDLRFAPDAPVLASGSNDWTAVQWRLDPAVAVSLLCERLAPSAHVSGEGLPEVCG